MKFFYKFYFYHNYNIFVPFFKFSFSFFRETLDFKDTRNVQKFLQYFRIKVRLRHTWSIFAVAYSSPKFKQLFPRERCQGTAGTISPKSCFLDFVKGYIASRYIKRYVFFAIIINISSFRIEFFTLFLFFTPCKRHETINYSLFSIILYTPPSIYDHYFPGARSKKYTGLDLELPIGKFPIGIRQLRNFA